MVTGAHWRSHHQHSPIHSVLQACSCAVRLEPNYHLEKYLQQHLFCTDLESVLFPTWIPGMIVYLDISEMAMQKLMSWEVSAWPFLHKDKKIIAMKHVILLFGNSWACFPHGVEARSVTRGTLELWQTGFFHLLLCHTLMKNIFSRWVTFLGWAGKFIVF